MNDPKRLLDEGTELETRLLASAIDDAPRAGLGRKVHLALGIGGAAVGTGTATTTAAAAASKATPLLASLGVAKWVGILALGTGAVASVAVVHRRASTVDSTSVEVPGAVERRAPGAPAVRTAAEPETRVPAPAEVSPPPAPIAADPPAPDPRVGPSGSRQAPAVSPGQPAVAPPKAPAPELAGELALLDRAHAALDSGDTQLALATLDRHDLEYMNGGLAPEALLLRIEAYARRHDDVKVTELGARFLSRYPGHPQAPQVAERMKTSAGR
jgi:TolA-binding protein